MGAMGQRHGLLSRICARSIGRKSVLLYNGNAFGREGFGAAVLEP